MNLDNIVDRDLRPVVCIQLVRDVGGGGLDQFFSSELTHCLILSQDAQKRRSYMVIYYYSGVQPKDQNAHFAANMADLKSKKSTWSRWSPSLEQAGESSNNSFCWLEMKSIQPFFSFSRND